MSLIFAIWGCAPDPERPRPPVAPTTPVAPAPAPVPLTLRFLYDALSPPYPMPGVVCVVDGEEYGPSDDDGLLTLPVRPEPEVEVTCDEQVDPRFMPVRVVPGLHPAASPGTLDLIVFQVGGLESTSMMWGYPLYDPLLGSVTFHVEDEEGRAVPGTRVWVEGPHQGALREDPSLPHLGWSLGPVTAERGKRVWFDNVEPGEVVVRARSPGRRCTIGGEVRALLDVRPATNTVVRVECVPR